MLLHQDVLIFIDNVFRFLQAGSEVSTLLEECHQQLVISPLFVQKEVLSKKE